MPSNNVQVTNIQVDNTLLVIPFNPYFNKITPIHTIPEFNIPFGVAVTDDGHIIVSENGSNCVTVLDRDRKKVKSFCQNIFCPAGVAITPDNFILVADEHKIQKLSMDGECISQLVNKVVNHWNLMTLAPQLFLL